MPKKRLEEIKSSQNDFLEKVEPENWKLSAKLSTRDIFKVTKISISSTFVS